MGREPHLGPDVPAQSYDVRRYDADDKNPISAQRAVARCLRVQAIPTRLGHFECTDLPPSADTSGTGSPRTLHLGPAESSLSDSVLGPLDHFDVDAPLDSTAGDAFDVTVTARDAFDNTLIGYTGTLQFASSDGQAVLPSDYAFTGGDAGIHSFADGVTLKTAGEQTIDVNDSVEISATGSATVSVDPSTIDHFNIANPGTQAAGVAFNVSITAKDAYGNTVPSYTDSKVVAFSGPGNSPAPSSTAPTYPGSVTFAAGVGTASITLFKAESTTLTATQASISGVSGNFTVDPGSANNFLVPTLGTQTAGVAFNETLTARDQWSNVATGYTGSRSSPSPARAIRRLRAAQHRRIRARSPSRPA